MLLLELDFFIQEQSLEGATKAIYEMSTLALL